MDNLTMNKLFPVLATFALALAGPAARAADKSTEVDFSREIRPIFASHCIACHGGVKAAGGVSFIYRDKALAKAKSGKAPIMAGSADESELIRRVTSDDPEVLMPKPGKDRPRLTEREIATLKKWIQSGAQWSEHWAFVLPKEPTEPVVKNTAWPASKADKLVLAAMEGQGLRPAPAAAEAEWLRRVSLDLIGLPPTLDEFETFRKDAKENLAAAKGHVVDRLLASPQFGERWASMWLDLARYADTFGFEKDPNRDIWPWRDWVIRAFNADMPFDQFTIKQLAGDLLDHPSADDLLATAFHRNTQNNTEGGTDDEEWRMAAVLDRVSTTWTTWQATTFGCVQCHSHPYDPFSHKDFYRFAAFFNNAEDCDQNDDFPRLLVPTDPARRDEAARTAVDIRRLRHTLNSAGAAMAANVNDWKLLVPSAVRTTAGTLAIQPKGHMQAGGTLNIGVSYTVTLPAPGNLCALKLAIFPDSDDPKKWPERGAVVSSFQATLVDSTGKRKQVKLREVIADYLAGPFDPQDALAANAKGGGGFGGFPTLDGPRWCILLLDEPLGDDVAGCSLELVLKQGAASNSGFQACPLRSFELSASTDARWTAFLGDEQRKHRWDELASLKAALARFPGTRVPIIEERFAAGTRDTRVFIRGNRMTRDESVEPGIPDVMHPPHKNGRLTRLDYARWLISDDNPLTARVLANRLWAEMYGRGIVETLEDFGTSGARPTHPELLDHLALRLSHEDRWSIKSFLREIALSATYGQTCRVGAAVVQKDPPNVFLSRGPRGRLTAEMVRDQALGFSGLLSTKQFGQPVFPPQPEGIWRSVYNGAVWKTSTGEDRYRRAVYTYCKRTSGYPGFLTFDAPTRDACTARRVATNTPLQALVTLNDPAFIEMAQAMARRMAVDGGEPRDIIARGCRLVTLEDAPAGMIDSLASLYDDALREYRGDPSLSAKLGATPESAAMVLVANAILNLDVAMTR
jgi:mono/diheme cytochrome c family protein